MSESVSSASVGGATSTAAPTTSSSGSVSSQSSSSTGAVDTSSNQVATGNPASSSESTTPESQQAAKRYLEADHDDAFVKVKIDGQDQEVSLKELKRLTSLEKASQKRMQEASRLQKQYQQQMQMLEKDPTSFLEKTLGDRFDTLAEERLARKYEIAQMSPEQRQIMEKDQQLEQYRQMDLQSKQSLLNEIKELTGEDVNPEQAAKIPKERMIEYLQQKQAEFKQHQTAVETELLGAWKETGLPQDAMFGQWVAAAMLNDQKMINAGKKVGEPLQARDAAAKVKERLTTSVRGMFHQMDAQAIQDFLGKDVVQKIRDFDVDRVHRANDPLFGTKEKSPGPQTPASEPRKQLNQVEWRKSMGLD